MSWCVSRTPRKASSGPRPEFIQIAPSADLAHEHRRPPQAVRPPGRPAPLVRLLAGKGLLPRRPDERKAALLDRHPAAERDGGAPPGARPEQHPPGHPDPL